MNRDKLMAALMGPSQPLPADLGWMTERPYAPAPEPNIPGLMTPGNIDLNTRPLVHNPDGSISTVRTMGYTRRNGQVVNVPTVSDEGQVMSPEQAMQYWGKRGQNLGTFATQEDADRDALALHNDQAWRFGL